MSEDRELARHGIKAMHAAMPAPDPQLARAVFGDRTNLSIFTERLHGVAAGFQIDVVYRAHGSRPDLTAAVLKRGENIFRGERAAGSRPASAAAERRRM